MPESSVLTASTAVVNGYTLVSNVTWYTESGLRVRDAAQRALVVGKETGDDTYTLRDSGKQVQYGTLRSSDVPRSGVIYSLAAHLAAAARDRNFAVTWVGAFVLANGLYAVISIRDDSIYPDGDRVLDRDAALAFLQLAISHGVEKIVAPVDLNLPQAQALTLSEFLIGPRGKFRPRGDFRIWRPGDRTTNSTKKFVIPLLLLLLVGGVIGGWYWWQQELSLSILRDAQLRAKEAVARKGGDQLIVLAPAWEGRPLATIFYGACLDAAHSAKRNPAAWTLRETSCVGDGATHQYAKDPTSGRLTQLLSELPGAEIADSGAAATVKRQLSLVSAAKTELPTLEASKRAFLTRAQESLLTASLSAAQAPQMPPLPPGQKYAVPTWKLRSFTIDGSSGQPDAFMRALDVPALRISKVTISANMRTKIEGTLYAN